MLSVVALRASRRVPAAFVLGLALSSLLESQLFFVQRTVSLPPPAVWCLHGSYLPMCFDTVSLKKHRAPVG